MLSFVICIRGCCGGGGGNRAMVMVFVIAMVLVWFALTSDDGRTDLFFFPVGVGFEIDK